MIAASLDFPQILLQSILSSTILKFMQTHCSFCQNSFDTYPYKVKRNRPLFCSTVCQYAFKKTRIKLICRICKLNFDASAHRVKNQIECFCTKKCADEALRVNKIHRDCKTCGQKFEFLESRLKYSDRAYCSDTCFKNREKTHVSCACKSCGEQFYISKSAKADNRGIYCSKKCYAIHAVKEKNPLFKHGHGWFKKMSKETRISVCSICDKHGKTDIHHIDGNERNNNSSNFITVCRSCHMRIHHLSGRHSIPIDKALQVFKLIFHLNPRALSTWRTVEDLAGKPAGSQTILESQS